MFPGAGQVRDWIEENLTIFQGSRRGEKFTVLPWQLDILRLLEIHPEVAWSAARANGKSVWAGSLACAAIHPEGPLHQPTGEVLVVASSAEQAGKVFDAAFLMLFGDGHPDRREWSWANNPIRRQLRNRRTGATMKVISSDPRRAHGAQPHLIICDEPAMWPPSTAGKMFAALRTARGKLSDSRLLILGTRPDDPSHFFERLLSAPGAICFSGDPEADPLDEREWAKANPSLDHLPDLREAIAHEAAEARRDGMQRAHFMAYRINAGTPDTKISFVCEVSDWLAVEVDEVPREGPVYFGIDVGQGASMTAIAAYWPETGGAPGARLLPVATEPAGPWRRGQLRVPLRGAAPRRPPGDVGRPRERHRRLPRPGGADVGPTGRGRGRQLPAARAGRGHGAARAPVPDVVAKRAGGLVGGPAGVPRRRPGGRARCREVESPPNGVEGSPGTRHGRRRAARPEGAIRTPGTWT